MQGVRTHQFKKQKLTRRVSQTIGRQGNNPEKKGKEEASERMLNEREASQLSDTEFKAMLSGISPSSQRITRNYRETTMNSLQTIST